MGGVTQSQPSPFSFLPSHLFYSMFVLIFISRVLSSSEKLYLVYNNVGVLMLILTKLLMPFRKKARYQPNILL